MRETLSKRVDEVGEKVDDVGVEVGEVKAELKEVHDDTTHLRVQQDHIARGVRGLCGVVSELMHGSPPTRAADDLRRFTVESTAKPLEAPPEQTALETTAARLAEALAAVVEQRVRALDRVVVRDPEGRDGHFLGSTTRPRALPPVFERRVHDAAGPGVLRFFRSAERRVLREGPLAARYAEQAPRVDAA